MIPDLYAHDEASRIIQDPAEPSRRKRTVRHIRHFLKQFNIKGGRVLEIGGLRKPCRAPFPVNAFDMEELDIIPRECSERVVVGDITDCPEIADESYDVVMSLDLLEHVKRPWLAAREIARILKPGGMSYHQTLFSWRYHPVPVDYWRYTPECLEFLFEDYLTCMAKGFDLSERRKDFRKNGVPVDELGGFIENWRVYHVGVKE